MEEHFIPQANPTPTSPIPRPVLHLFMEEKSKESLLDFSLNVADIDIILETARKFTEKSLEQDLGMYFKSWEFSREEKLGCCLAMFSGLGVFNPFSVEGGEFNPLSGFSIATTAAIELLKFLVDVESSYPPNPYHSFTHALDVMYFTYFFLEELGLASVAGLTRIDEVAMLIAALVHDAKHPGTNNSFQVQTKTPVALKYSSSCLEMQSIDYACMALSKYPFLKCFYFMPTQRQKFDDDNQKIADYIGEICSDMILHTDMKYHFLLLENLTKRRDIIGCFGGMYLNDDSDSSHSSVSKRVSQPTSAEIGSEGEGTDPKRSSWAKGITSVAMAIFRKSNRNSKDQFSMSGDLNSRILLSSGESLPASGPTSPTFPTSEPQGSMATNRAILKLTRNSTSSHSDPSITRAAVLNRANSEGHSTRQSDEEPDHHHRDPSDSHHSKAFTPSHLGKLIISDIPSATAINDDPSPRSSASEGSPVFEGDSKLPSFANGQPIPHDRVIMSIILHAADISNAARPFEISEQYSDQVLTEFFNQGDEERRLGLPISPNMDRSAVSQVQTSIDFIEYVVRPYFEILSLLFPTMRGIYDNLVTNGQRWEAYAAAVGKRNSDESIPPSPQNVVGAYRRDPGSKVAGRRISMAAGTIDIPSKFGRMIEMFKNRLGKRISSTVPNSPAMSTSPMNSSILAADGTGTPGSASSPERSDGRGGVESPTQNDENAIGSNK